MTDTASTTIADAGLQALFGDDGAPPTPAAELEQPAQATTAATPAATTTPVDPLAEELYGEDVLQTPEQAREAAKLLREERAKLAQLRRKAQNAHSEVERREKKFERTKQEVLAGKAQVAAFERAVSGSIQDLESGDAERFLTAVARLSKSADPASYWKKVSMKLASGGTFTEAEQKQAQADPEVQRKLEAIEQHIHREKEQRETAYIEHLKTQNLTFAQKSDEHPFVKLYSTEQPANIREAIAGIMIEEAQSRGRPIDVKTACGILEASLKAQYELSQRVGGNTDGEKGTAGLGPDAGRATSGQPPKPEAATRAPTTVPASLTATQGQTQRALSPREQRTQQVQSLPQQFWSQFGLE
jgi:plasmid stabilization system protein ParE